MLAAIVVPLAAGNVPVWVAASFDGDLVLVPLTRRKRRSRCCAGPGTG